MRNILKTPAIVRILAAALVASGLAIGVFALGAGEAPASAAGSLQTSMGVGCSASSSTGATLRFTVRARSTADVFIQHVTLDVGGSTALDSGAISTQNYAPPVVIVPAVTGTYPVLLTVDTDDLPDATRTATAVVKVSGSSVSCSVKSP